MQGHTHTHTHENPLNTRQQGHSHPELSGRVLVTHSHHHTHNKKFSGTETIFKHEEKLEKQKMNGSNYS